MADPVLAETWLELFGAESCHYRLEDHWSQPTGRLAQYLLPITIDSQCYGVHRGARLVGADLVGIDKNRRIIEETLHLKELQQGQRRRVVL